MELTEQTVLEAAAGKPVVRSQELSQAGRTMLADRLASINCVFGLETHYQVADVQTLQPLSDEELCGRLGLKSYQQWYVTEYVTAWPCPYCHLGIADIHAATAAARAARGR